MTIPFIHSSQRKGDAMKKSRVKIILICAVVILLIGVSGGLYVRAQDQVGPGGEVDRPTAAPSDKAAAMDGSTGSAPAVDIPAPGADIDVPVAGDESGSGDRAVTPLRWYTQAGAVFIPYTNSLTWTYGGSGCIQPAASGYWRASVNLPDNSIMKYVYFGFFNTAGSTASTAFLYRYTYTGTAVMIAQVTSSPGSSSTGYHYSAVNFPDETVDNFDNAYVFSWSGSATQQLCYVQVGYVSPSIFGAALPLVTKKP
jgi:hypothetical protein